MYRSKTRHARNEYDLYGDLETIKDALAEATSNARGKAGDILSQKFDDVKEKTKEMHGTVTEIVSDSPLKSIGIAMLAGIIVGYLWSR